MKKVFQKFIYQILMFLFIFIGVKGWSYYLQDNFANANNWEDGLQYNVALGVWTNEYNTTGRISNWTAVGNQFTLDGDNLSPIGYTATFYGIYALFTNQSFDASGFQPFGYEITRYQVRNDDLIAAWRAGVINMGIVQATVGVTNGAGDGMNGPHFTRTGLISEIDWQDKSPDSYYSWREKGFTNSKILLTAVSNQAGIQQDITSIMETAYGSTTNTTESRFRFVNDGDYLYWYVNPNPNGNTPAYSNTFYLISKTSVDFSNNLQPFMGVGNISDRGDYGGTLILEMTNFVIRTMASSVTSEVRPLEAIAGDTNNNLTLKIEPVFSTVDEAGIQEFYVRLPDGYRTNGVNWYSYTNRLSVSWITNNGVGTNVKSFVLGDADPAAGQVAMSIQEGGALLKVRFSADAQSEVFHPDNLGGLSAANKSYIELTVTNFLFIPGADSSGDRKFEVYVNNEKYSDTTWAKTATTGRAKSYSSTIVMPGGNYDSLSIRTVNPIDNVVASVRPGKPDFIYEGSATTVYYDVSARYSTNNNADITKVELVVPAGFDFDPSSVYSEQLDPVAPTVTTNGSEIKIVVDYNAQGKALVAGNGFDTIRLNLTGTTNFDNTNQVEVQWKSFSYSTLFPTALTNTTNALYPVQTMIVRKNPPIAESSLVALDGVSELSTIRNTVVSNEYRMNLRNLGSAGNNIKKVLIQMDSAFIEVQNLTEDLSAVITIQTNISNQNITNTSGLIWALIDYQSASTNLQYNGIDVVRFWAQDEVVSLTNDMVISNFAVYADNGNGDGWTAFSEVGGYLSLTFVSPDPVVSGYIETPVEEGGDQPLAYLHQIYCDWTAKTNVRFYIKNTGEPGNAISSVRLSFPTNSITNIANVLSIDKSGIVSEITNGAYYQVQVDYTNGPWLEADEGTNGTEIWDEVQMDIWDSVQRATNVAVILSASNVGSNYTAGGNYGSDNLTLNYLEPPVAADSYIEVPGGFIEAETNLYTVTYHINNNGRTGNEILSVFVYVPTNHITNIAKVSNSTALGAGIFVNPAPIGAYWRFDLTYAPGSFTGGASDLFAFNIFDNVINSQETVPVTSAVSNYRWLSNNIAVTPTKSQNISITPPPTTFGYGVWPNVFHNAKNNHTNTNVIVVTVTNSGKGSNLLDQVRITLPAAFVGKVLAVSNVLTGKTNETAGTLWISNGNYIWMDYTGAGTNLPGGLSDEIYLDVLMDQTNVFDTSWEVWAKNNSLTEVLTNTSSFVSNHGFPGTNVVSVVDKPYGYVVDLLDGDYRLYTTATEDYLKYKVQNGDSGSGRKIKHLYFAFPTPFGAVNPASVSNDNAGITAESFALNGTNFVKVEYASGFGAGGIDYVYMTVPDSVVSITNITVPFFADYGDTNRWFGTDLENTKSNTLVFEDPDPQGEGYVTPSYVAQDMLSNRFTFYLTNKGILGNHIYAARILVPSFMTNLSVVSSTLVPGSQIVISGGTNVVIYYTNTILSNGLSDVITFYAQDDISPVTNDVISGAWKFQIDNTVNLSGFGDVLLTLNKSTNVAVVKPAYLTRVSVEATNSVSTFSPNTVYSTVDTNYFKFVLENRSGNSYSITSSVTRAKITLPALLDLTTLKVTNLAWQGVTNYRVGQDLYLVYTNPMPSYTNDTVFLTVVDQVGTENTNFDWSAEVAYDSTMNLFKSASLAVGKSLNIAYVMPVASAQAAMSPNSLWQDYPGDTFTLELTNSATEFNNSVYYARVTAPSFVTNIDSVVSGNYSGIFNYTVTGGNVLELFYTNTSGKGLPVGGVDSITFNLYDDIDTPTNSTISGNWLVEVKNTADLSSTNVTAGIPLGKTLVLNVNEPNYSMRYSIEATNSVPGNVNQVLATIITNYLQLNLKNTSQTGDKVFRVRVPIPVQLSNSTLTLLNWTRGTNTVAGGYLNLYYTNALPVNSNDTVLFRVLDVVENSSAVAPWTNLQAAYDTTYTNYRTATVDPLKSASISYIMPQVSAMAYASPNEIYQDFPAQRHQIWITNTATEAKNDIYSVKIAIPGFFTNLVSISSTNYADMVPVVSNNQTLYLYYTNTPIASGAYDVVHFTALDDVNPPTNSLVSNWTLKVDNTSDGSGIRNASTWISKSLEIGILKPDYSANYYLEATNSVSAQQPNTLYSTQKTNFIKFVLINQKSGHLLQRAEVIVPGVIDPSEIQVVSQSWPGVTNFVTNRVIVFDFTNNLVAGTNDTVYIRVNDTISNISTNDIEWDVLAAFDTTYDVFKTIDLLPGRTNTFDYIQPAVSAEGYATPNTVSQDFPYADYMVWITNKGSVLSRNNVTRAEITLPAEITNASGIASTKGGVANLSNGIVRVDYTNSLKPTETDTITFRGWDSVVSNDADVYTNLKTVLYNTSDGSGGLETAAVNLKSFDLNIIHYPYGAGGFVESQTNLISPSDLNRMYSTLITNRLKYALYNTGLSGNPILYARIQIPSVVDTNTLVVTRLRKTVNVTNFISNNYLYLIYTNAQLVSGDYDEIQLDFNDTVNYRNTNVVWASEAAFPTTFTNFKPISEYAGKLLSFSYVMPSAKMQAWTSPNTVSQDFDSYTMILRVTNTATEAQNTLYRVELEFPSFVTNVSGFVSSNNAGLTWAKTASNVISLYYTNQGMNPGDWDEVRFTVFDNLNGGDTNAQDTWKVRADNTTDGSGEQSATVVAGKSFALAVTRYPYSAEVYIEAENAMSASDKTIVDATGSHNVLKYTLYNKSAAENLLTYARIHIPSVGMWMDTNAITLSNLIKTATAMATVSNDFVLLDYSAAPIVPNDYDVVRIELDEKVLTNNVDLSWTAEAAFDTTSDKFKPASVYAGQKNTISYRMPQPIAVMNLTPSEIYLNQTSFSLAVNLSNAGSGSSELNKVEIFVPSVLTNALSAGNITSALASQVVYANGVVTLTYTNFDVTSQDQVSLNLTHMLASTTNLNFACEVYNYENSNAVIGSGSLIVSSVPTYTVSPAILDTSTESNLITLAINNDISGNAAIRKVIIQLPLPFTNLLHVTNQIGGVYLGTASSLTLDYAAAGKQIDAGDYDTVQLMAQDSLGMGDASALVKVYADAGYGVIPMHVKNGKTNVIDIQMPIPLTYTEVTPNTVYLGVMTNHMSVNLTNLGTGTSELTFARIILPQGFDTPQAWSSVWGGQISTNSNVILVDYTTNRVRAKKFDVIGFDFINTVVSLTNLNVRVEAANTTNAVSYTASPGQMGNDQVVSLSYPPLFAEGYLQNDYHLYTIETNAFLPYRVVNRSYQTTLTQVQITLETNLFDTVALNLSNSRASGYRWDSVSNRLIIDYSGDPLGYMESDTFNLDLNYHLSNITILTLQTHVWVSGSTNDDFDTLLLSADRFNLLQVTNSTWGVVAGTLFPQWKSVDVKLYQDGSSTVMTNADGESLAGVSSLENGGFQVSRIPAGTYNVEYSAPYYRTTVTNGVIIQANQISMLSIMTMRNAPLNSSSGQQEVVSYDNTNTRVTIPEGAVDQDFSIDIKTYNLTDPQKSDIAANTLIQDVTDKDGLKGYDFDLRNYSDEQMQGATLKLDSILVLGYDQTNQIDRGWNESDLSIYYWDDTGQNGKWVRVGGELNKANKTLTARVSYLHRYYGIFGASAGGEEGVIRNVTVRPKIFTPGGSGGYFDTIRISFELDQSYDGFKLKIYDLKNNLIRSFERTGTHSQGEVAWDGLDSEGYPVKSGVGVCRVIALNLVSSCTILIVK